MNSGDKKLSTVYVGRKDVTNGMIEEFLNDSIVKFVFFDKQYSFISSDDTIDEIHKFKSRYPGNRYVKIPLEVKTNGDGKYPYTIDICGIRKPQGYVVVSKVDLWDRYKETRKAKRGEKILFGKKLCREGLAKLNGLLAGNVREVIGKFEDGTVAFSETVIAPELVPELHTFHYGDGQEYSEWI